MVPIRPAIPLAGVAYAPPAPAFTLATGPRPVIAPALLDGGSRLPDAWQVAMQPWRVNVERAMVILSPSITTNRALPIAPTPKLVDNEARLNPLTNLRI